MADGSNILQAEDAAISQALNTLDNHAGFMNTMQSTIDGINADINACYQAVSSTTFQQNVEAWIGDYARVRQQVINLQNALMSAAKTLNVGTEDAQQVASSWTSGMGQMSNTVSHALIPSTPAR